MNFDVPTLHNPMFHQATGEELLESVAQGINLLEKDYFGFTYYDKKVSGWLSKKPREKNGERSEKIRQRSQMQMGFLE